MKSTDKDKFGPAFNKFFSDPDFEKDYDREFREFALSELLLALMESDGKSIRKLAALAGVSPTTVQNIRSGKKEDVKLSNFVSIVEACGFGLEIVKGERRIPLRFE